MTKKRKILYGVLMVLGGLAFIVDRFVLSESATAPSRAAASIRPSATTPQTNSEDTTSDSVSLPTLSFPQHLPPYDPRFTIRDIFTPFPKWSQSDLTNSSADKGRSDINKNMRPSSSAIFMTQHKLDATFNGPRLKIAIVDGLWVHLGDTFDGCKLRELNGTSANFICKDGEAILILE